MYVYIYVCLYICMYIYIYNKVPDHLVLPHIKQFRKIGLELVSLPHFLENFSRKIFLLLYSINLLLYSKYSTKFLVLVAFIF